MRFNIRLINMLRVCCLQEVKEICVDEEEGVAIGVRCEDGRFVKSDAVFSNATPHVTFNTLLKPHVNLLPKTYMKHINTIDYKSPVTKINGKNKHCFQFCAKIVDRQMYLKLNPY